MAINELVYAVGDLMYMTFELLEAGGNMPNVLFIVIGSILIAAWILQMLKHQKEGA
ncbi:MAG: hypothetical protein MRY83_13565 [Flavobacteriales bacterium]|nr:hypothetical protein [Flavobacteriales bacterium]